MNPSSPDLPDAIAVVGLAVRFPGADSVEAFWQNLRAGTESLTVLSDEALLAAGLSPDVIANPDYVRVNGILEGAETFDADFFGMSPREAALTDPQHRVFLELAWTAMERAGYDVSRVPGPVGIFAGAGMSTYLLRNLMPNREVIESAGELALLLGNNKDFVPTRASYKLDLRGPSINVNTACSTSLVATHLACQSLLDHHCDMALAGGVSVQVPQAQGYVYTEGGIGSADGHCRAFDASAGGTVSGNGCGIVVLRRLDDALVDGDHIHAVIMGSAVNNDGADKAGFTAPSVTGQSQVIVEAQAVAGVGPADVSYVETHGTGTPLGDPIEVAALTEAFANVPPGSCAIGSVKTNFGHLDEAAGIAGLAKTVLALEQQEVPPSLHFETPNPRIDFPATPFHVNAELTPWTTTAQRPRIAGVSSFGIGGTNAHVVLREAPMRPATAKSDAPQLMVLSAQSLPALQQIQRNLANWLEQHPDANLADVAFTLARGRKIFAHRSTIVASDTLEARAALLAVRPHSTPPAAAKMGWVFSGQGAPYAGMLADLYASEPVVRDTIDQCAAYLQPLLGADLRAWLAPDAADAAARLRDTALAQPAVFVADYALAQLWLSRGLEPAVMIGHSLGEYVAACLAGVFTLEDALTLVTVRGKLMAAQPTGSMLAVELSAADSMTLAAEHGLDLAAVNASTACVISGPEATITAVQNALIERGVAATILETSHAFHSRMMEPILAAFADQLSRIELHQPQRVIISCNSGQVLSDKEATDPQYWLNHIRQPVQFAPAVQTANRALREPVWLEIGPGRGLASMVKRNLDDEQVTRVFTSTRHASESIDDQRFFLNTAGHLWSAGVEFDWSAWSVETPRRRVVLPTYPFQRQRHWIDAPTADSAVTAPVPFTLNAIVAGLESAESHGRSDPARVPHPRYFEFRRQLDPWCAALVCDLISSRLPSSAAGTQSSYRDINTALGVIPAFEKCLTFLLHLLAQHGYGQQESSDFVWAQPPAPAPTADTLRREFPEFRGIVRLVEHCLSHYAQALNGEIPAITVIYPEGQADLLESTAAETANHTDKRIYLQLLRQAIEEKLDRSPDQPLRILEVGIGDGLLAGELAPALKGRGVEYMATDLSRAFVSRAKLKAEEAGLDFLSFEVLDISRDPEPQGFKLSDFDFVVGLDVVHATPRLAQTLGHLRSLLKPGGCLGIVEKVRREPWVDLVWGLAEGWWYFADTDLRPFSPLMDADRWESVLGSLEFETISVLPRGREPRQSTDYALLLAQTPAVPRVSVTDWFQAATWRDRPETAEGSTAEVTFNAADGLSALIAQVRQLSASGRNQRLTLCSDGTPEQEMLTGALHTVAREYPQIECRHRVRLPDGGTRRRELQPLAATETSRFILRDAGVYLITGAFGSMGRVFARELSQRTGVKLVLLGRREPDIIWVQALEALGATVMARAVDLTDGPALDQVVAAARQRFGAINGVVHTAGVYGQGLMARREESEMAVTLAPKVSGTRNLVAAVGADSLDFLLLCSSVAAVAPEPGQVDYATANAFLDAFARHHHETTGVPTLSLGWGVWQDLGMMDHPSLSANHKQAVRDEIEREGWQDIGSVLVRHIFRHGAAQQHVLVSPHPLDLPRPLEHPLLMRRDASQTGRRGFAVRLDPTSDWIVDDHRLNGLALLPGTGFLELARAAHIDRDGEGSLEFSEVYFLAPLTFPDNSARELQVILQDETFTVISSLGGDRWLEHARGRIRPIATEPPSTIVRVLPAEAPAPPPPDAIAFGPRWQNLRSVTFTSEGGVAELELPPDCRDDVADYGLHPALFDIAIGFVTLRHGLDHSLPFCYERIRQYRALPNKIRSEVRVIARSPDSLELAAALFDTAGNLLLEVDGYRLRSMPAIEPAEAPDQTRLLLRPDDPQTAWRLVPAHRTAPGADEVEIAIEAAGLNFIEVLYAHGMLPRSPELEDRFGLECAGRVVRVGSAVTDFKKGDPVLAYANGCFASYVTVDRRRVAPRPTAMSSAEAATLAGAYATAHYALITAARLRSGESILIHAAAGGVGLAAVNIALAHGAVVYATAGSEEKRTYLRERGIAHVFDSRSAAFADNVMQLTANRGVDVVLNSLSGELLHAGLKIVAPRGRFVELGKRDLFAGGALDLSAFARIISFIVVDVGPDLPEFDELWREVATHFADGSYPPLPHRAFALTAAPEAFAFMAQAKHIGKVVLEPGEPASLFAAAREAPTVGRTLPDILGTPKAAHAKATTPPLVPAPNDPGFPAKRTGPNFSDPVESTIASIWSELLGVPDIAADDDFFNLRGDSLLAAQVMARIQSELAVKLPLSAIFDAPTVAGLAQRARSLQDAPTELSESEEEGEL